ncbi:helix-turn-helix domain-containing protein [Streptoverticillium reticulum]|uniref:helix-turn-helix domain-containing protein n=1 Tax=Streptoverticillium reticulum TaxID=1433415 RepID=UPI0039BF0717
MYEVTDPETFSDLMFLLGMSQRRVAVKAGVSQAFISQLLRGSRTARPVTAWRIAHALGVRVDELFVHMKTGQAPLEQQRDRLPRKAGALSGCSCK